MNHSHFSIFILFLISTVKCDIIPNAKSTVFKGEIRCNTTISDIVLDPINYPYHVWQLNINNTIKCDTAHINVTLLNTNPLQIGYAHVFNTNGELINKIHNAVVIHKNNNLTYYIQIKALNEYKFEIFCSTKCVYTDRRLLSSESSSSESSDEQTTTTTTTIVTTTVAPTTTTIVTTTPIITTTSIITTSAPIMTTTPITTTPITTTPITTTPITTTPIATTPQWFPDLPAHRVFAQKDGETYSDSLMNTHSLVIYLSKKTMEHLWTIFIVFLICNIVFCWVVYRELK